MMRKGIFCFFFFINLIFCTATEIQLSCYFQDNILYVSAEFLYENYSDIITSLHDGLEAEIVFQFRLYKKSTGFFSIFGDNLIQEKILSYTAYYNYFEKKYVFQYYHNNSNHEYSFKNKEIFIKNFFSLKNYILSINLDENLGDYYILARIRMYPVKLIPPLDIILLFNSLDVTTEWERLDILSLKD